jgi:hypothetical protein
VKLWDLETQQLRWEARPEKNEFAMILFWVQFGEKKTTMIFQDFFELKKIASQAFLMILS